MDTLEHTAATSWTTRAPSPMTFVRQLSTMLVAAIMFSLAGSLPSNAAAVHVAFEAKFAPGTLVVHTSQRRLYLVLENGQALQYTVGVGRAGAQWTGRSSISGKYVRPNWAPPALVRRNQPDLPALIKGGSPRNPMGAAALTLSGGDYAIHGTNAPQSIGGFVSYGCIRMFNGDIVDLFDRVAVGTPVVVLH